MQDSMHHYYVTNDKNQLLAANQVSHLTSLTSFNTIKGH